MELELRTHGGSSAPAAAAPELGFATDDDERPRPSSEDLVRRLDAIQAVIRDDALALQLEVTPNDTPVVGRLLGNMRAAVHSLVVFYGNQLAAKQTEINRVYGDALQQLLLERGHDRAWTAAQFHALSAEFSAQLAGLRADLAARDSSGETTAP